MIIRRVDIIDKIQKIVEKEDEKEFQRCGEF